MATKSQRNQAKDYMRTIDEAKRALDKLTFGVVMNLLRCTAETANPDGFPVGGSGGGSSTEEWTSTERAALLGLPDDGSDDWRFHSRLDPLGRAAEEALANLIEMAALGKATVRRIDVVIHASDALKSDGKLRADTLRDCDCCTRPVAGGQADPIRAGLCAACAASWYRAGKPTPLGGHRDRWIEMRRDELAKAPADEQAIRECVS